MDLDAIRADLRTFIARNFLFADEAAIDDGVSLLESGLVRCLQRVAHFENTRMGLLEQGAIERFKLPGFDGPDVEHLKIIDFVTRSAG